MSDILDVEQVRAMATPAGALWAGERAPTALALARTALSWMGDWQRIADGLRRERDAVTVERDELLRLSDPSWSPLCDGKAFEPMSEGLLEGWARQKSSTIQTIIAKSALHHITHAKAETEQAQAESRRCWTSERGAWVAERDDAVKRAKAAEEARDLAIVERDEAYKQRDTAAASRAEWTGNLSAKVRALESQIDDARAILGAAPEELLSDAARRVDRETQIGQAARDVLVKALALGEGRGR